MKSHPGSRAHPRKPARRLAGQGMMAVLMVCMGEMIVFRRVIRDIVMMKMEESLRKEHHEKSRQHPGYGAVDGMKLVPGMRKHVKRPHSKHQACDEADRQLQTCMRQARCQRQPPTSQRGQDDEAAINPDQHGSGHRSVLVHLGQRVGQFRRLSVT